MLSRISVPIWENASFTIAPTGENRDARFPLLLMRGRLKKPVMKAICACTKKAVSIIPGNTKFNLKKYVYQADCASCIFADTVV